MKLFRVQFRPARVALLLVFGLLLTGCAPILAPTMTAETPATAAASATSESPQRTLVRVELLPYLSFAPLFIAQDEGFFAEQGLDVEFVKLADGAAPLAALLQGDIDVSTPQIETGLLNAIARGGIVKVVADKGYLAADGCPAYALLARKELVDSGELAGPADLKGLKMVIEPLTSEGYYLTKLLDQAQLSLDDITPVDVPAPALADALKNGSVDLAHVGEPWITRLLNSGSASLWLPVKDVAPDFQWAVLAFGPTLLESNREAGQKFMQAYLQGVRQYNEGKTPRNLELVAKNTGLDVSLLEQACWPAIRNDGSINVQSAMDYQTWALAQGLLDKTVTEEQLWDPSFVEQANKALGPTE